MNIRLILSGLALCAALCVMPGTAFAQIVYIGNDSLNSTSVPYFINSDGTGGRQIQVALVGVGNPKWSRNGALIVAQGTSSNGGSTPDVFTFDRLGGSLHQVTSIDVSGFPGVTKEVFFPALSPDLGSVIVNSSFLDPDPSAPCANIIASLVYSISGVLQQTLAGYQCDPPGVGTEFVGWGVDWSPTASLVVSPLGMVEQCGLGSFFPVTGIVVSQPKSGSRPSVVTQPNTCSNPLQVTSDVGPVFSPDGTKIAYLRWFNIGGGPPWATSIRIVNLNGTNDHNVAFFQGEQDLGVSWSPGGTQLLFSRNQNVNGVANALGLWKINTDGTGLTQFLTPVQGHQPFSPNWLAPLQPLNWTLIGAADFNNDGHPDYVLFNPSTRQTAVWFLNNTTLIGGAFGPTLPVGWTLIGATDFNHDGHPDYLLFNPGTPKTAVWFLNNTLTEITGTFGPTLPVDGSTFPPFADGHWALIGAADVNNDGQPDYLLFNPITRHTAVWFLNNTTEIGGAFGPTLAVGWTLIGAADFNNDGHPDYVLFNPSTRQTAVWFLNNTTLIGGVFGPTLPVGWTLIGAADFNHDGHPDYLLFNLRTRQTAVWFLNNMTLIGGALGPTLPANLASP